MEWNGFGDRVEARLTPRSYIVLTAIVETFLAHTPAARLQSAHAVCRAAS